MPKDKKTVQDIVVHPEPEIQFSANENLLLAVEAWLISNGGKVRKRQESPEKVSYYDTFNNRLFREGLEYRVSSGGKKHQIKMPVSSEIRRVIAPDVEGILWRSELKRKVAADSAPSLEPFFGVAALEHIHSRVNNFFEKILYQKFDAFFQKTKVVMEYGEDDDRSEIEFSLQKGYIADANDATRRTEHLFFVEIELRKGHNTDHLRQAKRDLLAQFGDEPDLSLTSESKVAIGFHLIAETMNERQKAQYDIVVERTNEVRGDVGHAKIRQPRLKAA